MQGLELALFHERDSWLLKVGSAHKCSLKLNMDLFFRRDSIVLELHESLKGMKHTARVHSD